jgi:hypothetical protein
MQKSLINLHNFLFFSFSIFLLGYLFYQISTYLEETDFPVFYCAAKIALDPATPISKVYDTSVLMGCKVPEALNQEQKHGLHFIYSIPAAYILAPLALLPYFYAKTLIIILDILCYLVTIPQLIKNISPESYLSKSFLYSLLACLWLPFQFDIRFAQINSILFFLIAIATVKAKKSPFLAGFLFGVVTLFKLYPLGIALLIGIKNWRVAATCLFTVFVSLALTDSEIWFTKISNISRVEITPIYLLINFNFFLYVVYACFVAGITALIVYIGSFEDTFIAGLSITSLFAIMPIVEYYHLVLLIIPILFMAYKINEILKMMTAIPILLITLCPFFETSLKQSIIYAACLILWAFLVIHAMEKIHKPIPVR